MFKLRLYKLLYFSFALMFLSLFQIQTVTATENPLLLLDYVEIDEEHFVVNATLSDLPEVVVLSVPIAFNSQNAVVCGYNSETGDFFDIIDGVKSEEEIVSGNNGLIFSDFLIGGDKWNGQFICNDIYPYISNSDGIIKFAMYSFNDEMKFSGSNKVFSIYFKRLNNESPEIRIATQKNSKHYDEAVPEGIMFVGLDDVIDVAWQYSGDVFEDNSKVEIPNWDEIIGDTESGKTDKEENSSSTDVSDGSSAENNSSDKTDIKDDKPVVENETKNESEDKIVKEISFTDLADSHWAKEYIIELAKSGVINGYDDSTFRPEANITRAELAKIAVVAAGIGAEDNSVIFTDSTAQSWYNKFLVSAFNNGIIKGYPDNTFRPEDNVTREDLCTILYRVYFKNKAQSTYELSYSDSEQISDYAAEAVKTLSELKILNGRGNNVFVPNGYATRAEVAKVVYLCMQAE